MKNNQKTLSYSIIFSAVLIAVALMFTGRGNDPVSRPGGHNGGGTASAHSGGAVAAGDFRGVAPAVDHIRGNVDAPVSIVEFSDFECPFCSRLHPTLTQVVNDFPEDVNWVYRHFPLSSIHGRARGAAIASECIANLSDNDGFWQFADTIFANQRGLGDDLYRSVAVELGINTDAFESCLVDRDIATEVTTDASEAQGQGGRGTPFMVVVTKSGNLLPVSGALPYEQISQIVSQALDN